MGVKSALSGSNASTRPKAVNAGLNSPFHSALNLGTVRATLRFSCSFNSVAMVAPSQPLK